MKIKKEVLLDLNTDESFAAILHTIGSCLLEINTHNEPLKYLQQAMKIDKQKSLHLNIDQSFTITIASPRRGLGLLYQRFDQTMRGDPFSILLRLPFGKLKIYRNCLINNSAVVPRLNSNVWESLFVLYNLLKFFRCKTIFCLTLLNPIVEAIVEPNCKT